MQEVSDAWYGYRNTSPQRYDQTRYHGLNLNSLFFRGTIELRYFKGTLHAGEVKAYLQLWYRAPAISNCCFRIVVRAINLVFIFIFLAGKDLDNVV